MNQLELSTISKAMNTAKLILDQLKPAVDMLNLLYDPVGGVKATVDQVALNSRPEYSGLTKAQLDGALFIMTGALRTDINNAISDLAQLAARVPG